MTFDNAILSQEQKEKLLLDAGWKPWPIWVCPLRGVAMHEDIAVKEQQERAAYAKPVSTGE
jgi:hypothetical protein